jgi:hypothetical protein
MGPVAGKLVSSEQKRLMSTVNASNRRTLSQIRIGLLVVVGLLAITVEVLILWAYFNSINTAAFLREASYVTTDFANIQREALLLQVETKEAWQDQNGISRKSNCGGPCWLTSFGYKEREPGATLSLLNFWRRLTAPLKNMTPCLPSCKQTPRPASLNWMPNLRKSSPGWNTRSKPFTTLRKLTSSRLLARP